MHNEKVEERKSQHIKCPICSEERKELLANPDSLIQHLTKVHSVTVLVLPLGIIGNCLGAPAEKRRRADRAFKTNYKLYK
jgi:hypothetical protein